MATSQNAAKEVNKMAVYKDKNGTWYVSARYTNWKGEADRKVKRGFQTKREAAEWEKNFFLENAGNLDMTFEAFYQLYKQNTKDRIKLNTWKMKEINVLWVVKMLRKNSKVQLKSTWKKVQTIYRRVYGF